MSQEIKEMESKVVINSSRRYSKQSESLWNVLDLLTNPMARPTVKYALIPAETNWVVERTTRLSVSS